MGGIANRGFASMSPKDRKMYASIGGSRSSGNFAHDPKRASVAGRIGAARQPLSAKRLGGLNSHRQVS